ncbi:WD40 repeat domain-containing protein [Streptomyces sp. NPDC002540]
MSDDLRIDGVGSGSADVDGQLTDPQFLVKANPDQVLELATAASGPAARLATAVYRESAPLHRDAGATVRRQLLALDAARYGDRVLSARITDVPVEGEPAARWGVEWATGPQTESRFQNVLTGHDGKVNVVATAVVKGRPVAVTGSDDGTVRVWDLDTGQLVGEPLTGRDGPVHELATAVVDGWPLAITNNGRVWDLGTGEQVLGSHTHRVGKVAAIVIDSWPLAIVGGCETVSVWDMVTGEQAGAPLIHHIDDVVAVATATVDGCPRAVISEWVAGSSGHPADEGTVRICVWDLLLRKHVGEPVTVDAHIAVVVAAVMHDRRFLVITGGYDGAVRCWDMATGRRVGGSLTGHTDWVSAATAVVIGGRFQAATGSNDRTVKVWSTGRQVGSELVFPEPVHAVAMAPDGRLVVGFGKEVAVLTHR